MAVIEETFGQCFQRHLHASGLSLTELARGSWLSISYLSRLANLPVDPLNPRVDDPRGHCPSRDVVIRLALGLRLPIEHVDELLLSAGYAPLVRP